MPARDLVTKELASLLGVFSHPHRIRIVEELRSGEHDVNALQELLQISHSRVSQHLSQLRSHKLVSERREGRHHYYSLAKPELATWLLQGLNFIEAEMSNVDEIHNACEEVRGLWTTEKK
ncbi:MAG: metalloregulator ArsR/SmtB family transcription factor [Planctomycetota bacterium]|nr:metalloregulator ArsR/SmtB family transcription factor [Planctomycetota bacterium]